MLKRRATRHRWCQWCKGRIRVTGPDVRFCTTRCATEYALAFGGHNTMTENLRWYAKCGKLEVFDASCTSE